MSTNKLTGGNLPAKAGPGRPKGSQNKVTKQLKEMVLEALDGAGGVKYLIQCAQDQKTAGAFLTLVGKVLPLQVTGEDGGPIQAVSMTIGEFQRIAAEVAAKT